MNNLDFNFFCTGCQEPQEYREANCFTRYRIRHFERGDYISIKGDRVKELSIVVKGSINVSFLLDSGVIIRSIDHQAPTPIGGVALFSAENRYMVDTRALEPCTIISVARDDVTRQMNHCQRFLINFIDYSASRVDVLAKHLAILSQRSIGSKLAYYILMCSSGCHFRFTKKIKDLSEHLCVERPSLSRVLSQFAREGIITYRNGEGEILDMDRLKRYIE